MLFWGYYMKLFCCISYMWIANLLEKTVSFHGIHCFISKKQAVNVEGRFLPCKCQSACESNPSQLSQWYFHVALFSVYVVYSMLNCLNCYGQARKGFSRSLFLHIIDLPLGDRSHISQLCSVLGQRSKFMGGRGQKLRKGRTGGNETAVVQLGRIICQAVTLPSSKGPWEMV